MRKPRLNLANVALSWFVYCVGAALVLTPLDSRLQPHVAFVAVLLVVGAVLAAATAVAALRYFTEAWRKARTVPNRTAYILWLSLETSAAAVVLVFLAYGLMRRI
jgi:hypothetical protein